MKKKLNKTSALDVASFILKEYGKMTTWKLQKLVYYCQAWSLVWDEKRLFIEPIEAWANGPVVRELFDAHRREFSVSRIPGGDPDKLNSDEVETIRAVVDYYGGRSSQYLSDLTHMEDPWKLAREGISNDRRSNKEISLESMAEYYGSLEPDGD